MAPATRHGGRVLADQLVIHGAERAFCVPGESFLAVLDGLHDVKDRIQLVVCRHEAGAANMAEAHGKLTNRPGLCFVTRGPGATHAAAGVHTAMQDSTPMILFIGDVGSRFRDREAFQEVDFSQMFGPLAKWAARIDDARRIPEYVARAFQVATSGRHGPVVLALPEDMLAEEVQVADANPYTPSVSHPGREAMEHFRQLLAAAKNPFVLLGGPGWTRESCNDMQRFVEANALPTGCAFRFQDLLDNRRPNYVGDVGVAVNPILANRIRGSDLLIAVGPRLGEATTSGYTIVESPVPRQKLVHVHAGADEIGSVFQPELGIVSDMAPFARSAAAMEPIANPPWRATLAEARADYEAYSARREMPGRVQLCDVVAWIDQHVPEDTIIANGAGNFAVWMHRFHRYTGWRTQLGPTSGAMGYGLPAAIAAKLARPERTVIAWCGDGEFLMTGQELGTAVQHNAAVIAIIINNGMYGTIRMHQEKHYPGRVSGTELLNPQFAAYARAFGAVGEIVEETAQFGPAFERCVASGKPAVIEIRIDPQAITPNTTIDALRASAKK